MLKRILEILQKLRTAVGAEIHQLHNELDQIKRHLTDEEKVLLDNHVNRINTDRGASVPVGFGSLPVAAAPEPVIIPTEPPAPLPVVPAEPVQAEPEPAPVEQPVTEPIDAGAEAPVVDSNPSAHAGGQETQSAQ